MIVIDTNVLAYLWIPGELTPLAEKALARDSAWVTSTLWRSEFRSVLSQYLRQGRLGMEAALRCLQGAELQMRGCEYLVPSALVMQAISESKCSAYDCEYVALAREMDVRLVTTDKQVLREFPGLAVGLESFARGTPESKA